MTDKQAGEVGWNWPRRYFALLIVVAFAQTIIGLSFMGELSMVQLGKWQRAERMGFDIAFDSTTPFGWVKIAQVKPDSPLARAGAAPGDLIAPDDPTDFQRIRLAGEKFGFSLRRGGQTTHHELVARPAPNPQVPVLVVVVNMLAAISATLFGWLIIAKRPRDPVALCLALVMICLALPSERLPMWIPGNAVGTLALLVSVPADWVVLLVLPLAHYLVASPADDRGYRRIWTAYALCAVLVGISSLAITLHVALPVVGRPGNLGGPVLVITLVSSLVILVRGYRQASLEQRNRINIIGTALALYVASELLSYLNFTDLLPKVAEAPAEIAEALLGAGVPVLVAYAMIRKGLFDFSFAINRTLVYGAVSVVLLCSFGLAEWAVDHLVPEEWHQAGPLYSAGIALGLFLAFHRVRDFVEHRVEQMFFHSWHVNEERLRGFVHHAAHFEEGSNLGEAAVGELARFAGGAGAALYWGEPGAAYRRLATSGGRAPAAVDADDRAVVAARAGAAAVEPAGVGSPLAAALVLPIRDHGELAGFVTLEAKPQSLGYRPDEIELLGWAVQQIGMSLQSALARAARQRTGELEAQVRELERMIAKLAAPPRPAPA